MNLIVVIVIAYVLWAERGKLENLFEKKGPAVVPPAPAKTGADPNSPPTGDVGATGRTP